MIVNLKKSYLKSFEAVFDKIKRYESEELKPRFGIILTLRPGRDESREK